MTRVDPTHLDPRKSGVYTDTCENIECRHVLAQHMSVAAGSLTGYMVPCRTAECQCPRYRSAWWDRALLKEEMK